MSLAPVDGWRYLLPASDQGWWAALASGHAFAVNATKRYAPGGALI
jgi:hypothetical protein